MPIDNITSLPGLCRVKRAVEILAERRQLLFEARQGLFQPARSASWRRLRVSIASRIARDSSCFRCRSTTARLSSPGETPRASDCRTSSESDFPASRKPTVMFSRRRRIAQASGVDQATQLARDVILRGSRRKRGRRRLRRWMGRKRHGGAAAPPSGRLSLRRLRSEKLRGSRYWCEMGRSR